MQQFSQYEQLAWYLHVPVSFQILVDSDASLTYWHWKQGANRRRDLFAFHHPRPVQAQSKCVCNQNFYDQVRVADN